MIMMIIKTRIKEREKKMKISLRRNRKNNIRGEI